DRSENSLAQNRIRRALAIRVFDQPVARAFETVEQLLLGRTDVGVRHDLHHRIEVLQVSVSEIGDIGAMIEVDRFGSESLTGQINVIGARAAEATAKTATATADA